MEGGPPGFGRGFTCPALLGMPVGPAQVFGYGAFTLYGPAFQRIRLTSQMPRPGPATPECKHSGLAFCAFARHYSRNRVCFPFLGVLRCFTSPGVARNGLFDSSARAALWKAAGFPIRTSADQSLLTAPRGLSQSAASFIASWCQGIHRAPVYA